MVSPQNLALNISTMQTSQVFSNIGNTQNDKNLRTLPSSSLVEQLQYVI